MNENDELRPEYDFSKLKRVPDEKTVRFRMKNQLQELLWFLDRLEKNDLNYTLRRSRNEAMQVTVQAAPCEYWEVEFFTNGKLKFQEIAGIWHDEEAKKKLDYKFFQLECED